MCELSELCELSGVWRGEELLRGHGLEREGAGFD
jgi:hypothetical protein